VALPISANVTEPAFEVVRQPAKPGQRDWSFKLPRRGLLGSQRDSIVSLRPRDGKEEYAVALGFDIMRNVVIERRPAPPTSNCLSNCPLWQFDLHQQHHRR